VKNSFSKQSMIACLTAGMLVVLAIGIILYQQCQSMIESRKSVLHTQEAITAVTDLRSVMNITETGQRGFILTGKQSYLEPYEAALELVPRRLATAQRALSDNKTQIERFTALSILIEQKLSELTQTVELRKDKGFDAAVKVVRSDRGMLYMDKIRALIRNILDTEQMQLQEQNDRLDATTQKCLAAFAILAICAVSLFSAFGIFMQRYLAGLRTAHQELTDHKNRLEEFYAILAHELRTPITSIRGSLGLMANNLAGPLSEEAQLLVKISNDESDRMLRLINELLDLKKIEEGKFELNLTTVAPEVLVSKTVDGLSGMAQDAHIKLVGEVHSTKPISCDEDRIVQVLTNLISNAIKFSGPETNVAVIVEDNDTQVRFSVRDEGPGIPADKQHKLFQKFQELGTPSKHRGTGLGLAISKSIVEVHGGHIGFESKVGVGSIFWLDLPIQVKEQVA
jgi:signal transduction histidine kinase